MSSACAPSGHTAPRQACLTLLSRAGTPLRGARAVVLGRSSVVGMPVSLLLIEQGATVTICHQDTPNQGEIVQQASAHACRRRPVVGNSSLTVRQADIVVAGAGRPGLVRGDMLRPGAVLIDVGMNQVTDADGRSRFVGDAVYDEVGCIGACCRKPLTLGGRLVKWRL